MENLNGKVALVTGSSRGIGRAIAYALGAEGADVAINFVKRSAEGQAAELEIRALGRRCISIQADVSSANDVERLVKSTEDLLGPIDILVNNAGIARPQPIEAIAEEEWDQVMAANLKSCFLVTQAVLPGMRARKWGRIVNLSSVAAQVGGIVGPHYAASKAGLHGLMHFYAAHLAKDGVTANVIAPALIETEMVTSNLKATPGIIPVGRFGNVDEVASVVRLLAENAYLTGQTINVNGGWYPS